MIDEKDLRIIALKCVDMAQKTMAKEILAFGRSELNEIVNLGYIYQIFASYCFSNMFNLIQEAGGDINLDQERIINEVLEMANFFFKKGEKKPIEDLIEQ